MTPTVIKILYYTILDVEFWFCWLPGFKRVVIVFFFDKF